MSSAEGTRWRRRKEERPGEILAAALDCFAERGYAATRLADTLKGTPAAVAHPDELVGRLADRMAAADIGRIPVVRRLDGVLVGMVARKDLLRVRAVLIKQEKERSAVIRVLRPSGASRARSL